MPGWGAGGQELQLVVAVVEDLVYLVGQDQAGLTGRHAVGLPVDHQPRPAAQDIVVLFADPVVVLQGGFSGCDDDMRQAVQLGAAMLWTSADQLVDRLAVRAGERLLNLLFAEDGGGLGSIHGGSLR